jgi:hypothetical protein
VPTAFRRQNAQTISWFSDVYKRGLLNLDPPYQRRSVWNQSYKDDFISTVLLQYPTPAIFLYEEVTSDGVSIYQVVDGKQRLTAVFEFASGLFPVSEASPISILRGKYFEHLNKDDKTAFWTYQFPVEYLPTNDETIINTIFERINKNTAKLTRQELRHARFGGVFISVAEDLAEYLFKQLPEGFPRIESQSRKQMKDVELVANLLLSLEGEIRGYSQDELDEAFSDRDENWEFGGKARALFAETIECIQKIISRPVHAPLFKTRLRNQADFYSLFTAISELSNGQAIDCADAELPQRLSNFVALVENEEQRQVNRTATAYFKAARSNSNDTGPRKLRHTILTAVLKGDELDNTGTDTE